MDRAAYEKIERYMLLNMTDSAHDKEHIFRVLYVALDIAQHEKNVDSDVLVAACLLHDIGRAEQFENPEVCHARIGAERAYEFLLENNWDEKKARHVRACIGTHRYRVDDTPQSIEAKILFDADKIDATGTLGIARTIFYKGQISEPLYSFHPDGTVSDGSQDTKPSFFHEYKFKLENLYGRFYTTRGESIARERRKSAEAFYNAMVCEVNSSYSNGSELLGRVLA